MAGKGAVMRKAKKEELEALSVFFAEQFYEKEQMQVMGRGLEPAKARQISIDLLKSQLSHIYKHGDIFVTGDISGAIAGINGRKMTWFYLLPLLLSAMRTIFKSLSKEERKILTKNAKAVNEAHSTSWHKKHCHGAPYYLAVFAVDKAERGHGHCRELLEGLFEHAGAAHKTIVLETHTKENVPIYEHFGFELIETKEAADKSITEYRLLKRLGDELHIFPNITS